MRKKLGSPLDRVDGQPINKSARDGMCPSSAPIKKQNDDRAYEQFQQAARAAYEASLQQPTRLIPAREVVLRKAAAKKAVQRKSAMRPGKRRKRKARYGEFL